jgi:hypothetical protein
MTAEIVGCRQGIENRFSSQNLISGGAPSTVFFLKNASADLTDPSYAAGIKAAIGFQNMVLLPTYKYTARYFQPDLPLKTCNPLDALYAALTVAIDDILEGEAVGAEVVKACVSGKAVAYRTFNAGQVDLSAAPAGAKINVAPVLQNLISAETVLKHSERVFEISPLWEFLDDAGSNNPKLLPLAEVEKRKDETFRPVRQLRLARDLVNVAIAQQNLLSGGLMLHSMAARLDAGLALKNADLNQYVGSWSQCDAVAKDQKSAEAVTSADYFNTVCILHKNPVLRANFMSYWVRLHLTDPERAPQSSYHLVMETQDTKLFQIPFKSPIPIKQSGCGKGSRWCVAVPDTLAGSPPPGAGQSPVPLQLDMPAWDLVAAARLIPISTRITDLIALRERIEVRLAEYAVSSTATTEQKSLMYSGAMNFSTDNGE